MNIHKNARLTPRGREILISRLERGEHPLDVATAMGASVSTVYKWWRRYRAEGLGGLLDRSSRPNASPNRTPDDVETKVIGLRKERRIYHRIAAEVGVSRATVGRILTRHGLNRWRDLEPAQPVRRYERDHPGEMIHIDIKKLGRFNRIGHRITKDRTGQSSSRGIGWEFVHVGIDDHSRLGFADIMPDEKKAQRRRLPGSRRRLVQALQHHRRTGHDRQRIVLQIPCLQGRLQAARPQAHPHQTLHPEDKRQGRTLHPVIPARMGLCQSL